MNNNGLGPNNRPKSMSSKGIYESKL